MLGRGRNYKDKGTVERREGMVNTQQGGKGGANKGPSDSFMSWQFLPYGLLPNQLPQKSRKMEGLMQS